MCITYKVPIGYCSFCTDQFFKVEIFLSGIFFLNTLTIVATTTVMIISTR